MAKNYLPDPKTSGLRPVRQEILQSMQPPEYGGVAQALPGAPDPFGQYAAQQAGAPQFGTDYSNSLPGTTDINTGQYNPQLPGAPNPYAGYQQSLPGAPEFIPFQRQPPAPLPNPEPQEPRELPDIPTGPTLHNPGFFQ